MDNKERESIEILRALDGKIMNIYLIDGAHVSAFSEKQAIVLYKKNIMRKKETDVGIVGIIIEDHLPGL